MNLKFIPQYEIKKTHQVKGLFGEQSYNVTLRNGRTITNCYQDESNNFFYKKTTR
jgi:hypothetical protein